MVKDFYPTKEDYKELEDTFKIFDDKDQEIKKLNNDLYDCVIFFGLIVFFVSALAAILFF